MGSFPRTPCASTPLASGSSRPEISGIPAHRMTMRDLQERLCLEVYQSGGGIKSKLAPLHAALKITGPLIDRKYKTLVRIQGDVLDERPARQRDYLRYPDLDQTPVPESVLKTLSPVGAIVRQEGGQP